MMPILHSPGVMTPGQFGPIRRVGLSPAGSASPSTMSSTGMPSVMQTTSSMPASTASRIASAANGGGTKIIDALAPVASHGLGHGVEDRDALDRLAALAGRDAADHLACRTRGSRWAWNVPALPVMPCTSRRVSLSTKIAHDYAPPLRCGDDLLRGVGHVARPTMIWKPRLAQDLLALARRWCLRGARRAAP